MEYEMKRSEVMQEEATIEVVEKKMIDAAISEKKNNIIQVSSNKNPLYFYANLAKKYMQSNNEIELSALGMTIVMVVTVAEILKNNRLATENKINMSTTKDEAEGKFVCNARLRSRLKNLKVLIKIVCPKKKDQIKEAAYPEIEA